MADMTGYAQPLLPARIVAAGVGVQWELEGKLWETNQKGTMHVSHKLLPAMDVTSDMSDHF